MSLPSACAYCRNCQITNDKQFICALNGANCYVERASGDCGPTGKNWVKQ